jgi:hypothetical protein
MFLKQCESYILPELQARANTQTATKLKPWVQITSNRSPGLTLSSLSYNSFENSYDGNKRPNPIITDFSIDFSARGTLRKGSFKIKCFSVPQLEKIQSYFMEPGMSVFAQWGWNTTASTGLPVSPLPTDPETQQAFYRDFSTLAKIRNNKKGCYDNMLGIITKGESSINGNEFEVNVKICSVGELLNGVGNRSVESDEQSEEAAKGDDADVYSERVLEKYRDEKNWVKLNWAYFFNNLPNDWKTLEVRNWGAGYVKGGEFINYDESLVEDAKETTAEAGFWTKAGRAALTAINPVAQARALITGESVLENKFNFYNKQLTALSADSPISPNRYVKFSFLIDLFNKRSSIKAGDKEEKGFPIDIGTSQNPTAICGAHEQMFSCNPTIFIPNDKSYDFLSFIKDFAELAPPSNPNNPISNVVSTGDGASISFPRAGSSAVVDGKTINIGSYKWGWLGDVYVEHETAMAFLDASKESCVDALNNLLSAMETASENYWWFQVVEPTSGNQRNIIIDMNLINKEDKNNISPIQLQLYGERSIFLNASFNFDIPKGLANSVVMSRSSPNTQATPGGLRKIFSQEKDMVLTENFLAYKNYSKPTAVDGEDTESTEDEKKVQAWKQIVSSLKILLKPEASTSDVDDIGPFLIAGISDNITQFNRIVRNKASKGESTNSGPLPIKVNFTTLGISGFKFGDLISISGLPKKYSNLNNGSFQVLEVKHKVDNKSWTTDIEAMYRPTF